MQNYLNINEAATRCGVSIPTIRTKLQRGLLPRAYQVPEGQRRTWRIPLGDLVAAGLLDKAIQTEPSADQNEVIRVLELRLETMTVERHSLAERLSKSEQREERLLSEVFRLYEQLLMQEKSEKK
jgi:hypothetical protein